MSRYDELLAQKAAIESELEQLHESARIEAISTIKSLVEKFTITDVEVFGRPVRAARAVVQHPDALKPMYRNPETGETWAGRGREPGWMKLRPRHEFLIDAPTQQEPTIEEKLKAHQEQSTQPVGWSIGGQAGAPAIDNPFPVQA